MTYIKILFVININKQDPDFLEDVWKVLLSVSKVLDPSKSPLKRETLIPVPPFLRGVRGDLKEIGDMT